MKNLRIIKLKGKEIHPYLSDIAQLRIKIFKEFPYLYEGDMAYEIKYLKTYTECEESIAVLVLDEKKVIGVSTAVPLEFEKGEIQAPFIKANIALKNFYYFGESVLLPAYRGLGLYRKFFEYREVAAKEYGCKVATFCAVIRSTADLRWPKNYVPLDPVWEHFGYKKSDMQSSFSWKEIGERLESPKPMVFWCKNL